jgi:hypothetical protein
MFFAARRLAPGSDLGKQREASTPTVKSRTLDARCLRRLLLCPYAAHKTIRGSMKLDPAESVRQYHRCWEGRRSSAVTQVTAKRRGGDRTANSRAGSQSVNNSDGITRS